MPLDMRKWSLGGFSLWLPEGTTCEDGSLRNERAGTEFLATVPSVESITDKAAPFAVYDETFSDSYRVEEHEFGGYAAKSLSSLLGGAGRCPADDDARGDLLY